MAIQPFVLKQFSWRQRMLSMNTNERRPVDNLLNQYLRQEGIDKRYSKLILNELYDATQMTNDQLNRAANEIIVKQPSNK